MSIQIQYFISFEDDEDLNLRDMSQRPQDESQEMKTGESNLHIGKKL